MSSLPAGTQLNGTYEIGSLINAGGMGEVYRGHNIATGDPVAIKVVLPEYAADQLILDLFRKEARIINQLSHEAIVRYYGFARDNAINRSYLTMEFVEGLSLAERMRSGPLGVEEVSGLRNRIADGLLKAHELGIIHRDISPENVILQDGQVGRAKIIDFGIAKSTALASEGTLIGTSFAGRYNFASPEQVGMFRPATVSPKSDIYSFGLVLAAALLGEPIDMSGTMAEIMEKRMEVPDLSGIPAAMRELLTAMLQPNPAHRLASMAEVRDWPVALASVVLTPAKAPSRTPLPPRLGSSKRPLPVKPVSKKPPKAHTAPRDGSDTSLERSRLGLWLTLGGILVIAGLGLGGWLYVDCRLSGLMNGPSYCKFDPPPPVPPTPPVTVPPTPPVTVPLTPPVTVPPVSTTTGPGEVIANAVQLANYVYNYDGGPCFSTWPEDILLPDTALIYGYAADVKRFSVFEEDFKKVSGMADPTINARKVSVTQCPVVDAVRDMSRSPVPKPEMVIDNQTVVIGDTLEGSIDGLIGRRLQLLFVDEKGRTFDATSKVKENKFSLPMKQNKPKGSETPLPQLVVAVVSAGPLQSLQDSKFLAGASLPAADIFPALAKEAKENGKVSVAMKLIQLVVPSE